MRLASGPCGIGVAHRAARERAKRSRKARVREEERKEEEERADRWDPGGSETWGEQATRGAGRERPTCGPALSAERRGRGLSWSRPRGELGHGGR